MAAEAQIKITIDSKQANQSIDTLQADLKATRVELDRVIKTYGENSKQADALRKSVAGLEVEMGKLGVVTDEAVNSQASLKAQLRQLTNELATLEPGSARFQELSTRAGELRDRIQDANQAVNALAGNTTQKLGKALGSAAQIGVAGFQAVYSSMTLLGVESEDLQKTMTTLMAVMNLSQAITTLGDIPDAFSNIKAAVVGLIPSLGAATTASSGLAIAMNAVPFVAIGTALAGAVYSIYSYMQASKETAKEEEKRKKRLQELKKQQDEEAKSVAASSSEFTTLIYQLKATNKNSERRKELIKQINTQYGTTLQNLSDENLFQEQLNTSVREYIALQYNKFKLQKNQEYIDKQNEKRYKAEQEQAKLLAQFNKERFKAGTVITRWNNALNANEQITLKADESLASYRDRFDDFNKKLLDAEKAIRDSTNAQDRLGLSREKLLDVEDDLTKGGLRYVKQNEDNTSSTEDATDATEKYAEVLEKAKKEMERVITFQSALKKVEDDRITDTLEKDKKAINERYGDTRKQLIEKALEEQLALEEERFKIEGKTVEDWKKKETEIRKKADEEIKSNTVGILTQAELDILNKLEGYRQEDIANLEKTYSDKEKLILAQTEQININARLAELEFNKKNELEDIDKLQGTEEEKGEKRLEIRRKYADKEIELLKEQANKEKIVLDLQLQQTLDDTSKTDAEKLQAKADYDAKLKTLQMKLVDDINDINDGVTSPLPDTKEEQEKKLAKIQQYADKVVEIYSQISDLVGASIDERNKREEAAIRQSFDNQQKILDEQLKNRVISEEQYEYEKDRLDADREVKEKEQRRKAFEANKKLQIANAVIQGAQAALAAFASGFAVPGIGAILAPIYAAVAGAFAVAQIAQISSQQFTAAKGGIVPGNGSGEIDSVPSLLAPGEFVINSQSASMYPNLLSQINEAGGGKKLVPDALPSTTSQTTPNVFVNGNTGNNQPIKAYVVETDISESQRRINRIKQSVEF